MSSVRSLIADAVERRVCPGAVVEVGGPEAVLWTGSAGRLTYEPEAPAVTPGTVFDLASLTKVIATTSLAMRLVDAGLLRLEDRVGRWIPCWRGHDRGRVSVADLLAHAAGLPGTRPFHETCRGRADYERAICDAPLEFVPGGSSVYSDLGFILLGFILESAAGRTLQDQFEQLAGELGVGARPATGGAGGPLIRFGIEEAWRSRTAPTQLDPGRGRLLVGEVDDANAAALGGIAGHAGLFGTASGVGVFARALLADLEGRGPERIARPETVRLFARRVGTPGSSRALGWDTMLASSSCGERMSARAIGHTGFTGTSLWIDPEARAYVVLLTNRVYPAAGDAGPITALRRAVHDAAMTELVQPGGTREG